MKKIYLNTQRLFLFAVSMFLLGSAYGQITVTGTVLDGKFGGGLPGANVTVKGTTIGTITDIDGNYSIRVDDGSAVLVFSFIGYSDVQKTVGTQTKIDVTLNENVKELAEVVRIGYGVAKKEDITSSIVSVRGDELSNRPVSSADQALQGRAAGVSVKANSGAPGGDMIVNIRGISSLGDSKPLYVVDGVPQDNIRGINPSDIKDMAILKDASAAAIYGSRAAYGVIIISTKDGGRNVKEEVSAIEFTGYRGIQSAWKKVDLMNAQEYMQYRLDGDFSLERFSETQRDSIGDGVDYQDAVFRKAVIESYQLSFSGASNKTSYSVSGSYFNQEGIVIGSEYKRYTGRIRATHKLKNRLTVGESIGFNTVKRQEIDQGGMWTNVLTYVMSGTPNEIDIYDSAPAFYRAQYGKNPVGMIESKPNESNNIGLGGWLFVEYEPIDGLTLKTQGSFGYWNNVKDELQKKYDVTTEFQVTETNYRREIEGGTNFNFTNTATYSKQLYKKREDGSFDSSKVNHSFTLMVGTEMYYSEQNGQHLVANGIISELPEQQFFSIPNKEVFIRQGNDFGNMPNEQALASYLGRVEYGFSNKYNFNATIRRDGSSKFGSENRWGNFPALGCSWKINEEAFFKNNENLKFMNELRLRLGWGIIGNQTTAGPYDWAGSTRSENVTYPGADGSILSALSTNEPSNPYLRWEESETYNLGIDFAFLSNKILFNADFYIKNTNNMISKVPVASVAGLGGRNPNVNAATMRNTGADFSLSYRKGEGQFKYSISGNISTYKNEVVDLGTTADGSEIILQGGYIAPNGEYANLTRSGYSVGEFYGYKTNGIYQSWEEINKGPYPKDEINTRPGDVKIVDINGDGKITPDDKTFIGSPHPDYIFGISGDAAYNGFDFSFALTGSQGNKNLNAMKYFLDGDHLGSNQHIRRANAWTEANPNNEEPRASKDAKHYSEISDRYIEDGSFIRLQSIQLGYSLSDEVNRKLKISNLRVYVQAQNLLTLTKYSGYDPEIGSDNSAGWTSGGRSPEVGIDRGVYPIAKSYLLGLSFTF